MPKSIIYKPQGRAAEFSHLAINHYTGCGHQCKYCYLRTKYKMDIKPTAKLGVIEALQRQAPAYVNTKARVLLCFATDPYQQLDQSLHLTRDVLTVLRKYCIPFQVLTKNGFYAVFDFDLYRPGVDAFAVTLTMLDERWNDWETYASPPAMRIAGLFTAHYSKNIETWVSLEPVIDAEQSLQIIKETHQFVDLYKIGKLNYLKSDIDWRSFGARAIELCEKLGKPYFIKSDLAAHLKGIPFTNTDNRMADWRTNK